RRITGFQASNTLIVRIRDLGGLGAMMDAVLQDGANDFRGLSFGMADPGPHVDAARSDAVADAMRKAQLMAAAAGLRLGPVLSISEGGSGQPRPMMMEMAAARASDAMPVAPGEVSLSATVSMVFALKD
ncbi:MAG: SIMPL domain-containing protein, partial [Pseudomonadota bacterium]